MNTKIKHRVVGGLVLLAILAIFLPLLFHNSKPTNLKLSLEIPKKPALPQVQFSTNKEDQSTSVHAATEINKEQEGDLQKTKTPAVLLAKKQLEQEAAPVLAKNNEKADEPVLASVTQAARSAIMTIATTDKPAKLAAATQEQMPQAWVVQVGTFSNLRNANHLVKRLRKEGFDVYTRQGQNGARALVRVFVGPQIRKAGAVSMQRHLASQFHLSGVVRKYTL